MKDILPRRVVSARHTRGWLPVALGVLCCAVWMLCFGCARSGTASAVMSLNYPESLAGKTPSGAYFRLSDFRSPEFLDAVLSLADLEEVLTESELDALLTITPADERTDEAKAEDYVVASYRVTVQVPLGLRRQVSAQSLLDAVCQGYSQQFTARYRMQTLPRERQATDPAWDYDALIAYYTRSLDRISRYLELRGRQEGDFCAADGTSYPALARRAEDLEQNTLADLEHYCRQRGVAKEPEERIRRLEAENLSLQLDADRCAQKSAAYRQLAQEHGDAAILSVLTPTVGTDGVVSVSRPQTEADTLLLAAREQAAQQAACQEQIAENQAELDALRQGCTEAEQQTAQRIAETLAQKLDALWTALQQLDVECYDSRVGSDLLFVRETPTLWERCCVGGGLAVGAAVCAAGFLVEFLWAARARRQTAAL